MCLVAGMWVTLEWGGVACCMPVWLKGLWSAAVSPAIVPAMV